VQSLRRSGAITLFALYAIMAYTGTTLLKLTPCKKFLPEKLTVPQLVEKFATRFIAAFTSASHLSVPSTGAVNSLTLLRFRTSLCNGDVVCLQEVETE
jgi:hypothetical protein